MARVLVLLDLLVLVLPCGDVFHETRALPSILRANKLEAPAFEEQVFFQAVGSIDAQLFGAADRVSGAKDMLLEDVPGDCGVGFKLPAQENRLGFDFFTEVKPALEPCADSSGDTPDEEGAACVLAGLGKDGGIGFFVAGQRWIGRLDKVFRIDRLLLLRLDGRPLLLRRGTRHVFCVLQLRVRLAGLVCLVRAQEALVDGALPCGDLLNWLLFIGFAIRTGRSKRQVVVFVFVHNQLRRSASIEGTSTR